MPLSIQLTIGDAKGDQSTVSIPLPDATAVTDAVLFAQAIIPLIEPLLNGALRDARLAVPVTFTPWSAPASIADIQEKARFAFRGANNFLKSISLPTFVETFFSAGSKDVDTSDTDVAAFVTAMTDGIDLTGAGGSGVVEPCDTRGDDLTEIESAVEAWGNARG